MNYTRVEYQITGYFHTCRISDGAETQAKTSTHKTSTHKTSTHTWPRLLILDHIDQYVIADQVHATDHHQANAQKMSARSFLCAVRGTWAQTVSETPHCRLNSLSTCGLSLSAPSIITKKRRLVAIGDMTNGYMHL